MSRLTADTAWRRILLNSRLPAKTRVTALNEIERPSLALLRSLLFQKSPPSKLRLAVTKKYAVEVTRRELIHEPA
jgi:hypothetical protein